MDAELKSHSQLAISTRKVSSSTSEKKLNPQFVRFYRLPFSVRPSRVSDGFYADLAPDVGRYNRDLIGIETNLFQILVRAFERVTTP